MLQGAQFGGWKWLELVGAGLLGTTGHRWVPLSIAGRRWAPLCAAGHICANFATCSWEPLTMLNPQFVAGEHGLFGGHKSEDIRTFHVSNHVPSELFDFLKIN